MIFDTFEDEFEVKHFHIGSGLVSFFRIKDFEISTNKLMKKDLSLIMEIENINFSYKMIGKSCHCY